MGSASSSFEQLRDQDRWMYCGFAGEVVNLMTARGAGGNDHGVCAFVAHRWKQLPFTDGA
jgi:hypothetical protein